MALTETQKSKIRLWLGWGARYLQIDSALEQAFGAVTAETQTLIEAEMVRLAAIDTEIDAARTRFMVDAAGSIGLSSGRGDELSHLRSSGRQSAGRLATLMGVHVRHDVYSGAAPEVSNMLRIG